MELIFSLTGLGLLILGFFIGWGVKPFLSYIKNQSKKNNSDTSGQNSKQQLNHQIKPIEPEKDTSLDEAERIAKLKKHFHKLVNLGEDFFEETAHPVMLLDNTNFVDAVTVLKDKGIELAELIRYAGGASVQTSCIALQALNERDDFDNPDILLQNSSNYYAWNLFFLIKLFKQKASSLHCQQLFLHAKSWWYENTTAIDSWREFLLDRSGCFTEIDPKLDLDQLNKKQIKSCLDCIKAIGVAELDTLAKQLTQQSQQTVDLNLLNSIGQVLTSKDFYPNPMTKAQQKIGAEITQAIDSDIPKSILLVGEQGVGKSAVIADIGAQFNSKGWVVFVASASNLIAGQTYIGELDQRIQDLIKNISGKRKVLWIVPELQDFVLAGRHKYKTTSVLDILMPSLEKGEITMLAESTASSYQRVTQSNSRIKQAFRAITCAEMNSQDSLKLAQEWLQQLPLPDQLNVDSTMLQETVALADQYVTDRAYPGKLMFLLKLTLDRVLAKNNVAQTINVEDMLRTLSDYTGLPSVILDERATIDLDDLKAQFQQKIRGQQRAVDCLVNRVALIKAGLCDPSRPLGVFLFAGPTGTGKTEIAKVLASYLFGSEDRMIRLDMSEFQTWETINRIQGAGELGSEQQSLAQQVRKQPFSLILLDEFEKAHHAVWDLFLQVFDDGRLSDSQGNTADFRNCIIIMTSNLGATIQSDAPLGFNSKKGEFNPNDVIRHVQKAFRREFLNRFDETVVFNPLSRSVMREILVKEMRNALSRRGLRKRQWAIEWDDSAIDFLLDKGFTPDLGARPLKRAVDTHFLTPLSQTIVRGQFPEGDQFLFVSGYSNSLQVEFVDPDKIGAAGIEQPSKALGEEISLAHIAMQGVGHAEELQCMQQEYQTLSDELTCEHWTNVKQNALSQMGEAGFWDNPHRADTLIDVELIDRLEASFKNTGKLMERLCHAQEKSLAKNTQVLPVNLVHQTARQLFLLKTALQAKHGGQAQDACLSIEFEADISLPQAQQHDYWQELCGMYKQWAMQRRMQWSVVDQVHPTANHANGSLCVAISGFGAYRLLLSEMGLHVFETPKQGKIFNRFKYLVKVIPQPELPLKTDDFTKQVKTGFKQLDKHSLKLVRSYRYEPSPLVRDHLLHWRSGAIHKVLQGNFDYIKEIETQA